MQITATPLDGMLVIEPRVFEDERGYFLETHHLQRFQSAKIDSVFVQDNLSFSRKNVLRGLHFQKSKPQAKLIQAISGGIFNVVVDLRSDSPTFDKWFDRFWLPRKSVKISTTRHHQFHFPVTSQMSWLQTRC